MIQPKGEFDKKGCEMCNTPMRDCKGITDPNMDGIHLFRGKFYCDRCLQELGHKIRSGEISEDDIR